MGYLLRFIDNHCTVKYNLEFNKSYKDKYPSELEFKKQSISTSKRSFSYNQKQKKLRLSSTFDKWDAFPFFKAFATFGQ